MTIFRPCIDLHNGQVKQIVGGTLTTTNDQLLTNFTSELPPQYYASLYKQHALVGAHVIKLGPGNDESAAMALEAYPHAMQIGGGITQDNALHWLDERAAGMVIVTSWLFPDAKFDEERLRRMCECVGKCRLVIDLSCRKRGTEWIVAMNKWQTLTDMKMSQEWLSRLSESCSEFLVHAADVEGLCQGIDKELVERLGQWSNIPVTYAGGGKELSDLDLVHRLSNGTVDLTFGSALDIFGGSGVKFEDAVKWKPSTR